MKLQQSYPATCPAIVASDAGEPFLYKRCGQPLKLMITRSPMVGWDFLVVIRCAEHLQEVHGVQMDYSAG